MEKLGLIVDSLQVQEIEDPTGYIENLGRPHAAAVASQARIAQAAADREATEREQEADALKAEARRASQVKQAGYQAEIDDAEAKASLAGPLAEAHARQEVVVEETKAAELEAQREEQRLQATVRKPADAKAYEQVTLSKANRDARIAQAEAQRQEVEMQAAGHAERVKLEAGAEAERVRLAAAAEAEHVRLDAMARADGTRAVGEAEATATQAKGLAEGEAVRAKGMAEADSIAARARALAENQDAVIGQQLADKWPEIVAAAAKPFGDIDQMIVLNGAQGLSDTLAQAMSQGVAGLQLARNLLAGGKTATAGATGRRRRRPRRKSSIAEHDGPGGEAIYLGDAGRVAGAHRHLLVDRRHPGQGDGLVPAPVDDGGRAARLLRQPLPRRRGGQHLLLPAHAGADRGLGRADAARVHHGREGVVTADRSSDLPPLALARPAGRRCRPSTATSVGSTPSTCRPRSWRRRGTGSATRSCRCSRPASSGRCCSSTRAGSAPRTPTAARSPRRSIVSTGSGCASSSATPAGWRAVSARRPSSSSSSSACPSCASTSPPGSRRRCRRWWPPPTTSPSFASTAATPRPGRGRYRRPPSGSGTSTPPTSCRNGFPGCGSCRRRPTRSTSS